MKTLIWVGAVLMCAMLAGCDQNKGGKADDSREAKGAGSSRRDYTTTNAPDNSRVNQRDRSDKTLTPLNQGNNEADLETTRRIRKALNDNPALSTTAKNIKVITTNGKVTLRGPVASEGEKQQVNQILQQQGITSVDNQLEIKTSN